MDVSQNQGSPKKYYWFSTEFLVEAGGFPSFETASDISPTWDTCPEVKAIGVSET